MRDGDEWIVNGQKVWNTLAHLADFGMLVTRTDPDAPKHKGMTYFALDMHAPGVEVRPLRQITGEAEFNEVYMTDVRVPDAAPHRRRRRGLAGQPDHADERAQRDRRWRRRRRQARRRGQRRRRGVAARSTSRTATGADKDRLMQLWVQAEVGRLTNMRAAQNARSGNPGPEMSIAKLAYSELNKALYEFAMDLMGADALIDYDYTFRRPEDLDVHGHGARAALRVPAGAGQLDRGRHVGDHAQHPRRAGPRPARRAAGRQGDRVEQGAAQLSARVAHARPVTRRR